MLFVLEIFGWVILMIITIALYVLAGVVVIIAGMVACRLLWHIFKPVFEYLRKNICQPLGDYYYERKERERRKEAKKMNKGRKYYEDYSGFR